MDEPFLPLEDYALVGDCSTSALIGRNGSLDWMCVREPHATPVFGRLLDRSLGGTWKLAPSEDHNSTFRYLARSAVLETTHVSADGTVRVRDAMLPPGGDRPRALVRVVEALAGRTTLVSSFDPRAGYDSEVGALEPDAEGVLHAHGMRLVSTIEQRERDAEFTVETGDRASFVLGWSDELARPADADALLDETLRWWDDWTQTCGYTGPFEDAVVRSAITLKLLTHEPSGAIVAAPTTSLPELVGGDLNWDYRYTWLRDAALTLYALYALGLRDEGDPFFDWICARVSAARESGKGLAVMYDVHGNTDLEEEELPELEGYRGSQPVRIGNAAHGQVQLDIFGEVLDCFASAEAWGRGDKLDLWDDYASLANWVCDHWEGGGSGLWEKRGAREHYVYSLAMAWVALDRTQRVAREHGLAGDVERWASNAEAIRTLVLEQGWNEELGAWKTSVESPELDASNLLLPLVGFLPPDDPRVRSNLERTRADLSLDGLLHRNLDEAEGSFTICSLWCVSALTLDGRYDDAVELFQLVIDRASSPLGLLSEEVEDGTGALVGNFPQAFTHAAVISAAVNLARAAGIGDAPESHAAPGGAAHLVPLRV